MIIKYMIAMNVPNDILEIDIYATTNNIEECNNSLYSHFCIKTVIRRDIRRAILEVKRFNKSNDANVVREYSIQIKLTYVNFLCTFGLVSRKCLYIYIIDISPHINKKLS